MAKLYLGTREIVPEISKTTVESLTVTPSTTAQVISPSTTDGFSPVNVSAVTASIDPNIVAGNIRKGVTILGVTGNVEGGFQIPKGVDSQGKYGVPVESFTFTLPSDAIDAGVYVMSYAFYNCSALTSADLSSLTTMSKSHAMQYAFQNCTNLTSVDLSNLTTVSGSNAIYYTFRGCTGLTSVDLSSLTTVSGSNGMDQAFYNCISLTSVDLSSLTTVSGSSGMSSAFYGCTSLTGALDLGNLTTISGSSAMQYAFRDCSGLTSVDLSSLTTVSGSSSMYYAFYNCTGLTSVDLSSLNAVNNSYGMQSAFYNCTSLQTLSFPALTSTSFGSYTNQFNNMLKGARNCTVHFPSNLQSVIGSWADVTAGFGGTNTTVLFDLPATT